MANIDASLSRLGTDYVDLYQIHRWDYYTPIEETMEALHAMVKAGKDRYIGASSMYAWQFAIAQHVASSHGWSCFVSLQNYLKPELPRRRARNDPSVPRPWRWTDLLKPDGPWPADPLSGSADLAHAHAHGLSSQSFYADTEVEDGRVIDVVEQIALERGVPMAQVALAWVLGQRGVCAPIVGASRPEHLDDAVAALQLSLSEDDVARLQAPYVPHAVTGFK